MFEKFFPKIYVDNIYEITPELLKSHRIEAVILDIDNTLVTYEMIVPTDEVVEWIEVLKKNKIKVCILSNASKERVAEFSKGLDIYAVHRASKPSTKGFIKAIKEMKVQPFQTAVIGDQIFTDIYGGNKSSMFTILVKPITIKEILPIRIKRMLEKPVLMCFFKEQKRKKQIRL